MSTATSPMHICIVGINYAPEVTGCAPYNTDLAEKLVELGHQVTVVTGFPHYPQWNIAAEYANKSSHVEVLNGVEIIRARHYVPKTMNALTRGLYEFTFLINGWWRSRAIKPDIVIAVSPALTDMVIGKWIKRRTGATLKILVQDLMGAAATQSSIKGGGLVAGIVERIEGSSLRVADSVAVITESFKDRVLAYGVPESKVVLSPNYSHSNIEPLDRDECRQELGWSFDDLLVIHTGNMGLKQDLGNVIEAARLLKDERPDIKFYLIGDGSQRKSLENQAQGLNNVKFFDLFSTELYPKVLGAADILLINESPDQADMSFPSKLTSYEAAGKMIVAISSKYSITTSAIVSIPNAVFLPATGPTPLVDHMLEIVKPDTNFSKSEIFNLRFRDNAPHSRSKWALNTLRPESHSKSPS